MNQVNVKKLGKEVGTKRQDFVSSEDREFASGLVAQVQVDFANRQAQRRRYEAQWQLNSNFLLGNQYCMASGMGEILDSYKDYYWQEREVFNHIAPIVETRLSKLNKVRPKMAVRPVTNDENDLKTAAISTKILNCAYHKLGVDTLLSKGMQWSEVTGSVFYKLSWDSKAGKVVGMKDGERIYEGDVRIDVCPPYEIYPDSIDNEDVGDCASIIHAKAMHIDEIERIYGVFVKSSDVLMMATDTFGSASAREYKNDHAIVIERYTAPTHDKPDGELVVVASDTLLHYGALPFRCGDDNSYALPFIKQDSLVHPGSFYGISVIERAIPIQRAYNAVKNRKHEFMNRIAMGVLAVEDGSVDTDNLESDGLAPGKILVYRQGAPIPKLLDAGAIPSDFSAEEDKLISEFVMVSGVSEIMRSSEVPSSITSGTGLKMLLEQDESRLSGTVERIKRAVQVIGKFVLRMYKQFASAPRLSRYVGDGGSIELISWRASALSSDDIIFEAENSAEDNLSKRKELVKDMLNLGLLHDENGKLTDTMRYRVLDLLGYGTWDFMRMTQKLHIARAQRENLNIGNEQPKVKLIDEHNLHIEEHTVFMLSEEFDKLCTSSPELDEIMTRHIIEHRAALNPDLNDAERTKDDDNDTFLDEGEASNADVETLFNNEISTDGDKNFELIDETVEKADFDDAPTEIESSSDEKQGNNGEKIEKGEENERII